MPLGPYTGIMQKPNNEQILGKWNEGCTSAVINNNENVDAIGHANESTIGNANGKNERNNKDKSRIRLPMPKVKYTMSIPNKPPTLNNLGNILSSGYLTEWKAAIFAHYNKYSRIQLLSLPFPMLQLPLGFNVFKSLSSFKIETLPDHPNTHKFKPRLCLQEIKQTQYIYFQSSYSPMATNHSLHLFAGIVAVLKLTTCGFDVC